MPRRSDLSPPRVRDKFCRLARSMQSVNLRAPKLKKNSGNEDKRRIWREKKKTTFFFYTKHPSPVICTALSPDWREREKKHGSSGEPALLLAVRDKGGAFAISAAAAPPHVNSIVDERDSVRVLSIRADEATTLPTLAEP